MSVSMFFTTIDISANQKKKKPKKKSRYLCGKNFNCTVSDIIAFNQRSSVGQRIDDVCEIEINQ